MPLDGKMAHCGENFCAMCVSLAKKSSEGAFFVPAGTHLDVKLLTAYQLLTLMSVNFLRSFFGDWYLQRFLSVVSV
jgi:hypothetical protein